MAWRIKLKGKTNKKRFGFINLGDSGWVTAWDEKNNDRINVTKFPAHQIKKIKKVEG